MEIVAESSGNEMSGVVDKRKLLCRRIANKMISDGMYPLKSLIALKEFK